MIKFVDGNMVEYRILPLVDQYDPILRTPTKAIDFETETGGKVAYMAMSIMETLNKSGAIGLAANQVGLPVRICAVALDNKIWSLINPKIIDRSPNKVAFKEGCLSFPGLYLTVGRSEWVEVEFYAANSEKTTKRFTGISATVVQHEMDHLDGIVFTDLVSPLKLEMARKKAKINLRRMKRNIASVTD
jgi:peptide deformylase